MTDHDAARYDEHLLSGGELLRQGRLDDAIRELSSALQLEPQSAKALALLGLAYFRDGEFSEARVVYERLVEGAPGDAAHQLNLGLVHLKLGNTESAIQALERSRDVDPSEGRAVSYLGLAYARAGRFTEAYQAFLISGQTDLASEISENLPPAERAAVAAAVTHHRKPAVPPPPPPPQRPRRASTYPPSISSISANPFAAEVKIESSWVEPPAAPTANDDDWEATLHQLDSLDPEPAAAVMAPSAPATELEFRLDENDSLRFVGVPVDGRVTTDLPESTPGKLKNEKARSAISRAVAQAAPASGGVTGHRVPSGGQPPQPLSEFATARLVRPEDGDHPFEIGAGGVLIVRVVDKMFSRTEGVDVTGGTLAYEPAMRRSRGQNRSEPFETDGRSMFVISGRGHLIAAPVGGAFTAVSLDEDIFYLREDLVFGFEPGLRWENGHVPGSRNRIPMVQFRGSGAIAFRTQRPLVAVKLAQDRVLYVDANALAGWIGRVVPRAVTPVDSGPTSELFVECAGEGVVLVQSEHTTQRSSSPG